LNLRLNKNLGHWDYILLREFEEELLEEVGFGEELDEIFGVDVDEDEITRNTRKSKNKTWRDLSVRGS